MELVWISPGTFMMGSRDSAAEVARKSDTKAEDYTDEHPQHRVTLTKGFWVGKYEVTQAQWQAVMGDNPSNFRGDTLPVEMVSWNDCQEFIEKLNAQGGGGFRLPTEAEWEYACRAGTTTPFCFGETISTDQANYNGGYTYGGGRGENRQKTTPVGSFPANAWGLHDMHGNVWEWCQDWYDDDYYANSPERDPGGPSSGTGRAMRGASWYSLTWYCRSASRDRRGPVHTHSSVGFRVVCCPAR
ncbi:MAG: formylglycine-generating enzyme family protein [Candidatus Hydrogenedentes bacterium]|nr:formylglycine-generating enzyme family protein [Candidatus Hydrogenedentota bacterium]